MILRILLLSLATVSWVRAAGRYDTLAAWDFRSWKPGSATVLDRTGHGFALSGAGDEVAFETSRGPAWDGRRNTPLNAGERFELGLQGDGRIRYEAKVFLASYPSPLLHNGRAVVMGFYAGPKLLVTSRGRIQVGGQRGHEGHWNWFAPESRDGAVPLGRWTTLAIEADPQAGRVRAWVDGKEVVLSTTPVPQGRLRPSYGNFLLGADPVDGQQFPGLIAQARVLEPHAARRRAPISALGHDLPR